MSSKEGFNEMYKIVCSMLARPESSVFREPVDWKGLGLVDYPEIIKKPMDLGTIKGKIEAEKYESYEEIASDIRLVWTNCMNYNRDGSEYYHVADKFAKGFEDAYLAFRRLEDSKSDMDRIPTVDEKMQLSYDIFKIANNEMVRVLTIIEENSPNGLSRKAANDEILINFDALTPRCFHEVNTFVQTCLLSSNSSKKSKKKKTGGGPAL